MIAGIYIFLGSNIFVKWNRRIRKLFGLILIVTCIIFFAENIYSGDQQSYFSAYNSGEYYYFESGYRFICQLLYGIGLDYVQFKYVIGIFEALLLFLRFKNVKIPNINWVIAIWMISSFMYETEQSRFYLAMVIVIYATKYLEDLTKKNTIKYIVLILTASQIHTSTYVYLIFLLCKMKKSTYLQCMAVFACMVTVISALLGNNWEWLGKIIYMIVPKERILFWFKLSTNLGFLGPVVLQFICFYLLWAGKKYVIQKRKCKVSREHYTYFNMVYKLSIILFIAVPLYTISTDFIRILRGCFILFFSAFAIVIYYARKQRKAIYMFEILVFVAMFNILTYHELSPLQWGHYESVYDHLLFGG